MVFIFDFKWLGSSHFPALQRSQNVDKVVQGPCAIGSESAAIVKKWSLFDQSLNFFLSGERDGKIIVQSPREVLVNGAKQWSNALIANFLSKSPPLYVFQRTADKLWSRKGSMVIRFLAPEEKYSRKCVVQTDVGTKDVDALNSSSGTPDVDIGNVGGSVIYEDNVVQANVVQPVDQGIKLVEIEGGINPVDAIGFSAAVSNNVVSIESTICVPCVEVKSVTLLFLLRGCNDPLKQNKIVTMVRNLEVAVLCLLETSVKENNSMEITRAFGNPLHILFAKLKRLKPILKKFNKEVFGEISKKVQAKQLELSNVQKLVLATHSAGLIASEKKTAGELIELSKAEEFFKQKSRIQFIKDGVQNFAYFFRKLKVHHKANTIHSLQDRNGVRLDTFEAISGDFIKFFSKSLGAVDSNVEVIADDIFREILDTELSTEMQNHLVAPVTQNEIKDMLFSMNGNKAPGPNGFSAKFFQVTWQSTGMDFSKAI
ncbi:hypothetical protein V6N13_123242 [Hibiscus sabdariffa]